MSALALVLAEMGYKISGSDLSSNDLTEKIERMGGRVFRGHRSSNVASGTGLVVYSSSIQKTNPELVAASRKKIKIVHRAQVLGELLNRKKGIAVTGTHGKTTTTSLIAVMLERAGIDPTVIIGGEVAEFGGNAKYGRGPYLVAEADESDSSFLKLKPFYSVITNIEMEHLDHYKTLDDILRSYRSFLKKTKKGGTVFYNNDDPRVREMAKGTGIRGLSFGLTKGADVYARAIRMEGRITYFDCVHRGRVLGKITLRIPGRHNVLNALAAILVGMEMGIPFKKIAEALAGFEGAKRRFHLRINTDDLILVDDYGHHPTEIRAVLEACRNWRYNRLIVIFQPHRYTRTLFLADDFGRCFAGADKLILTDIYAASEKPIRGVSIRNIYEKTIENGMRDVTVMKKERIAGHIERIKERGDMIVVMGAGNICKVADDLAFRLKEGAGPRAEETVSALRKVLKGDILTGESLARHTSFRIGGPADIWAEPRDADDLKRLLRFAAGNGIALRVIGRGTNILADDRGFRGIMVRLASPCFRALKVKGAYITAGGGFDMPRLVRTACAGGLGGFESLVGIPGTVGGALYMNAGGWKSPIFRNVGEFVTSVKVMDRKGRTKTLRKKDLKFGYRSSNLEKYIVLEATFKLKEADPAGLNSRCVRFLKIKREKQVLDIPSAGCLFKNPENFQFTCGQMIDMLGLKGRRIGGAEISEKHANFIINRGGATCSDVMKLASLVKEKVLDNYNVGLELEVKLI